MPNLNEAIVITAFVFLFYCALDALSVRAGIHDRTPRWAVGALASFLAVLLVRFYINA